MTDAWKGRWEQVSPSAYKLTASITFKAFLRACAVPEFSLGFSTDLNNAPFDAIAWETPAMSRNRLDAPFECVVTHSPSLARGRADSSSFTEAFARAEGARAVRFRNLAGDSELVAPTPIDSETDYAHLAAFLRTAPSDQVSAVWSATSEAAAAWLAESPRSFWLSTAGLGVAWLHIRLDPTPKYYRHEPYRS